MNKRRREELGELAQVIEQTADALAQLRDEEQDCLDNYPEGFRESERYEQMETALEYMEEAEEDLTSARRKITDAITA